MPPSMPSYLVQTGTAGNCRLGSLLPRSSLTGLDGKGCLPTKQAAARIPWTTPIGIGICSVRAPRSTFCRCSQG